MSIEVQGHDRDVRYAEHTSLFIRVEWDADDEDGETAGYFIETYLGPHVDTDDYLGSRSDVTHERVEEAIENVLAEKAQDDATFTKAKVKEVTDIRIIE